MSEGLREDLERAIVLMNTVIDRLDDLDICGKPFLSIPEAAWLASMAPKTLSNVLSRIRRTTGRDAPFVCRAGGHVRARIDRRGFEEWLRSRPRRQGRPPARVYLPHR